MSAATADLVALAGDLSRASGYSIESTAHQLLVEAADHIVVKAKSLSPKKTGALADSIEAHFIGVFTVVIGPEKYYGEYQEFGTASRGEFGGKPYVILPKKPDGYLVFEGRDGNLVFTKKVVHPGIPPHPYMRPAVEDALEPFTQRLVEMGALFILRGPKA